MIAAGGVAIIFVMGRMGQMGRMGSAARGARDAMPAVRKGEIFNAHVPRVCAVIVAHNGCLAGTYEGCRAGGAEEKAAHQQRCHQRSAFHGSFIIETGGNQAKLKRLYLVLRW